MSYREINQFTSKNYTPAAQVPAVFGQPRVVKTITVHHWGLMGQKFDNVVNFLCTNNTPTSAHYVIEDGKSACIVDPDDAAWHSGNATGNATSIGLELRPEATDGDYETASEVIRELRAVYGNVPLVPHKHWHNTACPGKWDLARLDRLARSGTLVQAASTTTNPTKSIEEIMATLDKEDLAAIAKAVWSYDQQGKTKQAWHYQKNVGVEVWATKLKNRLGKTYSASANLTNNNVNGWDILGLVKSIAGALVKKSDIDAAVADINAHTDEAMVDAAIEVEVTVKGQEKI